MRRFSLIFKNDLKLFSKHVLSGFAIIIAVLFIFVAKNYSFERGKSTIYVNIQGETTLAEFLNIQAQKDSSTVVLDSKDKVIKSMNRNPFCYGLDIDTENNKVDIIIKGYESERVVNNIAIMSAFLMNNSQDFSDIDVNYLSSESVKRKQQEKQIIPVFVYMMCSLIPLFFSFILMLEHKKIAKSNVQIVHDYKTAIASKMIILVVFHMLLSIIIALFSCELGFDFLLLIIYVFLSCALSSGIGCLLSTIYNNIYASLKAMLALFIIIVLPIWNLSFGAKRNVLFLDFYYYPYKAIRDITLYKDMNRIGYNLAIYPVLVLIIIFICIIMFYKKLIRLDGKG